MRSYEKNILMLLLISTALVMESGKAIASAVLPTTSALIIEEADREGTIGIKNTNSEPVLLYSKVQRLDDEDLDAALIPSPQAVVVQPGETQTVRLLFRSKKKLDKEHLARILFMGIPPETSKKGAQVGFMLGQDLPVVIRPAGYVPVENKWEFLKWKLKENQLCVSNETKYAIRFVNHVVLTPVNIPVTMPKAYALPESNNCTNLPSGVQVLTGSKVNFSAVTDYGYMLDNRQSAVTGSEKN